MRGLLQKVAVLALPLVIVLSVFGGGEIVVSPEGISPHAAVEHIRKAKKAGDRGAWTVFVKAGVYEFEKALVLTSEDSGTTSAPVKWIGEEGAIFTGGKVLSPWRDDGDGVWSTPIPVDKNGKRIFFESLYVNGRRADRARIPLEGKLSLKSWNEQELISGDTTNYVDKVVVNGDHHKALAGLSKEQLAAAQWRVFVKWAYASYPIDDYDQKSGVITVSGKVKAYDWRKWNGDVHNYFYIENVEAGFKNPGQWFYDVKAGRIKYRPLAEEKISSFEAIAPTANLISLVEIKGDLEKGAFVHDISFENIAFTASRTDGDKQENGTVKQYLHQAARRTGATVYAIGAHRVKFEYCRVFNTENYAFKFDDGCVSNAIVSCEIVDAGAGGIWIGNVIPNPFQAANPEWRNIRSPWDHPFPTKRIADTSFRAVRFNVIDDNLITRCGRVNPEGCGIVLTHAADTKVMHNEISDLYYTGISVGWTWGYYGSYAQRNEISFNRITDIGQGKMADMGGIYTLGASFDTVITNNVIMNVNSISYGGWGMYNDEGSEGIRWENNLVVNTSTDSYHTHFGRSNMVVNCIMANARRGKLCVTRSEKHRQVDFERNIICWQQGPIFAGWGALRFSRANVSWKDNLAWCYTAPTEINGPFVGYIADPLFENPEKGDWRLKKDSPALKLGFKPWDYSLSGRRKDRPVRVVEANAASFQSSLSRARALCARGMKVVLRLAPGEYIIEKTLEFNKSDSNLTIESQESGKAKIIFAQKVKAGDTINCAVEKLPDCEGFAKVRPRLPYFFYDGKWAVEARWPNEGFVTFTDVVDSGLRGRVLHSIKPDNPTEPGAFVFESDRPSRWNMKEGVWLCGYFTHDWSYERIRVESFDAKSNTVYMAAPATYGIGGHTWSALNGRRFFATGTRAELDAPGEYYFDRKTRKFDFIAPPGTKDIFAVTEASPIVKAVGVDNLLFRGIVFEYAYEAFVVENCRDLLIEDCTVRNICARAVSFNGGKRCKISKSTFSGIGLSCAFVNGGDRRKLENADHEVSDSTFTDFAKVNRTYSSGLWIAGCGNRILRNKIFNAPHMAVNYAGNEHLISSNEVWNVMYETGDCGAFYTGRDPTSRGNVLSFNYVHDCGERSYGKKSANVMAFYLDDCDAGDLVISNRVVNVPRGLLIGGGQDNRAIGNTFEKCDIGISIDDRGVYSTEKWDSHIDRSWQITRRALEMPIFEEPWKSRYPHMYTFLTQSPREPLHVQIKDNRFIECTLPIEYYLKGARSKSVLDVKLAK